MTETDHSERLRRIENKIDQLSEVMIAQARIEEQQTTLFKSITRYEETLTQLMGRVTDLERISFNRGTAISFFNKSFWAIAGGGIALAVAWFSKGEGP
jgi:hypothetical protein